jgi:RNA polymerase sigma-70 factor, ECF subfamily
MCGELLTMSESSVASEEDAMIAGTGDRVWGNEISGPAHDREEADWVLRARAGDEESCGRLLGRYRDRAVRLASHVLGRPSEAEDAAQEAFIRAFRHIGSYRGESRFYTWLYHIVVRVCIERQRRARWKAETPLEEHWALHTLVDRSCQSDTRLLVEALMKELSPAIRATLVLREVEGLEYEEIAEVLAIPVGTVRSRLNAARSQFRKLYEAAMQETARV